MKRIRVLLVLFFGLLALNSCAQKGFSDESKLVEAFLPAMKNGGDELTDYIDAVCPSAETFETMKSLGVSHFGFPEVLDTYGYSYEEYRSKFSSLVYDLRDRLERDGILDAYKVVKIDTKKVVLVNKVGKVYASGAYLTVHSNGLEAVISFSDMMQVNGEWKVFSTISYV